MKKNNIIAEKKYFTLIEMMIVVGLIAIVLGISLALMNKTPARLVIVNTAAAIEQKMTIAQTQSSLQGIQKTLIFDKDRKVLFFSTARPEDGNKYEDSQAATPQTPEPSSNNVISTKSYIVLPASVEITFPDFDEDKIAYNFYPDSSASGPDMMLSIKGHQLLISVSPLTGIAITKEINNEKYY